MAGQPNKMAKKVTELEAKLEEVWRLIEEYIPEHYEMYEGPFEETSDLCHCWNMALYGVIDATVRMARLATMLRAKAGIPEPGPRVATRAEIATTCGQGANGDTAPMEPADIPRSS